MKIYKNNFGEINENEITLIVNNREQTLNLKNLVRIQFVKRRKYHTNYIAFFLSIYLLLLKNTLSHFNQILIYLITIILLIICYFFKTFQYRFVLIKKNHFTEIIVSKKMSKDAKNLAYQINKTQAILS